MEICDKIGRFFWFEQILRIALTLIYLYNAMVYICILFFRKCTKVPTKIPGKNRSGSPTVVTEKKKKRDEKEKKTISRSIKPPYISKLVEKCLKRKKNNVNEKKVNEH